MRNATQHELLDTLIHNSDFYKFAGPREQSYLDGVVDGNMHMTRPIFRTWGGLRMDEKSMMVAAAEI